ncbi:putative hydrolase [Bacillus sp. TS-2]|nr:putative hydrolase [Bacillus sp. TS-2]
MIKRLSVLLIAMSTILVACSVSDLESWLIEDSAKVAPVVNGEAIYHFLDVGQGDSTLIQSNEATILIDTGRHDSDVIFEHLNQLGVIEIDLLILTHPHADHIGNADQIIRQYGPSEVWMDGNQASSKTFELLVDALIETDTDVVEARSGLDVEVGDFLIEIIHPAHLTGDFNNDSISGMITYGELRFLFTGDAEERSEFEMLDSGFDLEADIFKVGHHGSSTSNTREFIEAVNPEIGIYSASENNSYGHPHIEVESLFDELGIEFLGTAEHGTIKIVTDGENYTVELE